MTKKEIIAMLKIRNTSKDYYDLIQKSNKQSRKQFGKVGYVFAQIGINAEPCSKDCKFCSMGAGHYALDSKWKKDFTQIQGNLKQLLSEGINDFFLMATADYSISDFIVNSSKIKKMLPFDIRFVANVGDFSLETARKLKDIGYTGAYHIKRLREGIDTLIKPEERIATIENALKAKLELYYCIEPIGPEHSYEEIAEEILFAKQYPISVMAVMRRIPVLGTPLFGKGKINAMELTKIVAVTNLVIKPKRAMNVHEPTQMSLLAGVNQLYAEVGANPRDIKSSTEKGRGFTPSMAWDMLAEAEYFKLNK